MIEVLWYKPSHGQHTELLGTWSDVFWGRQSRGLIEIKIAFSPTTPQVQGANFMSGDLWARDSAYLVSFW